MSDAAASTSAASSSNAAMKAAAPVDIEEDLEETIIALDKEIMERRLALSRLEAKRAEMAGQLNDRIDARVRELMERKSRISAAALSSSARGTKRGRKVAAAETLASPAGVPATPVKPETGKRRKSGASSAAAASSAAPDSEPQPHRGGGCAFTPSRGRSAGKPCRYAPEDGSTMCKAHADRA